MKYRIYKIWHNGGKQLIEESSDGNYTDRKVKLLNSQIDYRRKNQPLKYILETLYNDLKVL